MSVISNTKWQMVYQGQDIVHLSKGYPDHGDPQAYAYKKFPHINQMKTANKPGWEDAPTENGLLDFRKVSRLTEGGQVQLDFTYFRTFVNIPKDSKIKSFNVIINNVDDGARVYLFNNKYAEGVNVSDGAKLNGKVETDDFSKYVVEGQNMIVIVQFDDCPGANILTGGIDIKINGEEIKTDPSLAVPSSIWGHVLEAGSTIQTEERLTSENGKFAMRMQSDGHLCIYSFNNGQQGRFDWGSGRSGFENAKLVFHNDGRLVVLDDSGNLKWQASDSRPYLNANKAVKLVLEDDGRLNLYDASNQIVWANK